jgi:hemolysin III
MSSVNAYSPAEEKMNVVSHGFGLLLSVFGLIALVIKSCMFGDVWSIISFTVFGISLCVLYSASTFYHNSKIPAARKRLKIFDHASIYVLIAGTYTPITLVTLHGATGWVMFGFAWSAALIGIILKFFFTGKYNILSTAMYVVMGWIIVLAAQPLMNNLPANGLLWLISGGIAYTIGAVLYSIKSIKFNHAIFHIFVLIGSICHFIMIYFYTLPE